MLRRLSRRGWFRFTAIAGMAGLAAAVAGCSVSHMGLGDTPDATVDVPADKAPPVVDTGPDLACGACDSVARFVTLPGGRFMGTTSGDSANEGTCGGSGAPEAVFKIVLNDKSDLFVTTHGTGFDTVLYLRNGCCGPEVACNDDADGRKTSVLSQRGLVPGTYYIYVDGATSADAGPFTVDIYATPAAVNPGEACGNPLPIAAGATPGNTCGFQDDYSPPAVVQQRRRGERPGSGLLLRARPEDQRDVQYLRQHLHRHRALRARRLQPGGRAERVRRRLVPRDGVVPARREHGAEQPHDHADGGCALPVPGHVRGRAGAVRGFHDHVDGDSVETWTWT